MRKALAHGALLAMVLTACGDRSGEAKAESPPPSIIPLPRDVSQQAGQFNLTATTPVRFSDETESVARYFTDLVQRTRGIALPAQDDTGDPKGAVVFQLRARESTADEEGYSLTISPERVVVSASSSRGLFYGAVTLWQLLTAEASGGAVISLPSMTIDDSPRFRWRGLMLDSARHYQSPEFIRQFIDWMALHKLNTLHWHLTDDQGWRLEIRKYPQLTNVGAWRVPAGPAAAANIDPATGKPRQYGGFYTQDQVREIVAYAAQRHITIVPEIEMPGHASAPVAAYPQLGVTGTHAAVVPADWGVYSTLFNVDDATFAFLEDVLTEVIALFPSEYIHVGGDEAVKNEWKASPRIQSQMRTLGVKDEHALQSYFVQRIEKFLNAHDRRLIGWDEILEGGLAPDATVMSWRGIEGAVAAATAGHDAILSPAPTLYLDNRQAADGEPGRGNIISLETIYRFNPAPVSLQPEQRKHMLGVQANIWTEHMRSEERVEYMTFPRASALAEVAWSAEDRLNWEDFQARLPAQLARYAKLGIRYASPSNTASSNSPSSAMRGRDGVGASSGAGSRTSHQLDMCTDKLVLSLEDDAPLQGNRATFLVDVMNPCWIWPAADLSQVGAIKATVGQVPFNFQIGAAVKEIPRPAPQTVEGELEVRLDGCDGKRIAAMSLAPAMTNHAVTELSPANIEAVTGQRDLCFRFTRKGVDPIWAINSIELVGRQ